MYGKGVVGGGGEKKADLEREIQWERDRGKQRDRL